MSIPLSGLLICLLIMSLAERLSSKFHICSRNFASRPNVPFSDNLSLCRGHYRPKYQPPEGVYLLSSARPRKIPEWTVVVRENIQ